MGAGNLPAKRIEMKKTVAYTMENLDNYDGMGLALYWTPGASDPYWASQPSFMYDKAVATPQDFLEAAGYDCFVEDHDYSGCNDMLSLEIERPEAQAHIR